MFMSLTYKGMYFVMLEVSFLLYELEFLSKLIFHVKIVFITKLNFNLLLEKQLCLHSLFINLFQRLKFVVFVLFWRFGISFRALIIQSQENLTLHLSQVPKIQKIYQHLMNGRKKLWK